MNTTENVNNVENKVNETPEWMDALVKGDYIDFSKSVKQEINTRYANHPFVKNVEQRNTYYNNLAKYFANAPITPIETQANNSVDVSSVSVSDTSIEEKI